MLDVRRLPLICLPYEALVAVTVTVNATVTIVVLDPSEPRSFGRDKYVEAFPDIASCTPRKL